MGKYRLASGGLYVGLSCMFCGAALAAQTLPTASAQIAVTQTQMTSAPASDLTPKTQLREGKLLGPTFFVLGVWIAPPQEMEKWRRRGINTILSVGQGINPDQHHAQAVSLNLLQIRHPRSDKLAEDLANPSVIALETDDEPTNIVGGKPRETPDGVASEQAPWRAAAQAAGVIKPIFTNHIGNHIWHRNSRLGLNLAEYHKRSDWYGADTYQISEGKGNLLTQDGFTSTYQGQILRQQRMMAPTAPLLSFIQTSSYQSGMPTPTPGEFTTQIWSSIVYGASMIGLFPVRLSPTFAWDATPDDLVAAIRSEFTKIAEIETILIDKDKGGARPGRIYPSAPTGMPPQAGQLPWPFEARLIPYDGRAYSIVVNLSSAPASLTYAEWGVSNVLFQPSEVKRGFGQDWIVMKETHRR